VKGGEDLDELERRFRAAVNDPKVIRRARRADLRRNLSRRARLRLWYRGRVDAVAIWLACHGRTDLAQAVWRVAGLWRSK
jgi:hypothetical protein